MLVVKGYDCDNGQHVSRRTLDMVEMSSKDGVKIRVVKIARFLRPINRH